MVPDSGTVYLPDIILVCYYTTPNREDSPWQIYLLLAALCCVSCCYGNLEMVLTVPGLYWYLTWMYCSESCHHQLIYCLHTCIIILFVSMICISCGGLIIFSDKLVLLNYRIIIVLQLLLLTCGIIQCRFLVIWLKVLTSLDPTLDGAIGATGKVRHDPPPPLLMHAHLFTAVQHNDH